MALAPTSLHLSKHQNWKHPLMRMKLGLHQSLQGLYTGLVPILIFLNHCLFLASNIINCGATLRYYLWPYHRQARPLKLTHYFSSHHQHLDSGNHCHLITSFWTLTNKKIDHRLSHFQTHFGAAAHATLDTQQLPELPLLIVLPLCRVLVERLFQFQKCINSLLRFRTFWTVLCLSRLVIQFVF